MQYQQSHPAQEQGLRCCNCKFATAFRLSLMRGGAMVLPMSELELRLVRALDQCELKQGAADSRFCDELSKMSRRQSQMTLSKGQRAYLWRIAYRYRYLLAEDLARKAEAKAGKISKR